MKFVSSLALLGCSLVLTGCGNSGGSVAGNPSGTGPFDSRGNYVEAWADSPDKWNRGGSRPAPVTPKPTPPTTPPVVATVDLPPPDSVPIVVAANNPSPSPVAVTPRPAPKPVATKPKPKPKPPAATRYVVKKGDTLYAIAARNKTTISALQRANGISGSLIRPGQSLKIPR